MDKLTLPVFPLSNIVFFPRVLLPLKVFEPRYRQLVQDLLQLPEDKRMIAISNMGKNSKTKGDYSFASVATIGKLVHVEKLDNGMSNIVLYGQYTAEVEEMENTSTPYRICEIKRIREEYWKNPVGDQKQEREKLMHAIDAFVERTKITIQNLENVDLDDLINGLSFSLNIPEKEKQQLLEKQNLNSRLTNLIDIINNIGYYKNYIPSKDDYTNFN